MHNVMRHHFTHGSDTRVRTRSPFGTFGTCWSSFGGPTLPSPGWNWTCERVEAQCWSECVVLQAEDDPTPFNSARPVFARGVLLLLLAWKSLLGSYRILHRAERSALAQTGLSWIHPSCRRVPVFTVHLLNKLTARSLTNNNHRSFVKGKLLF